MNTKFELIEELTTIMQTLRICSDKVEELEATFFLDESKLVKELPLMKEKIRLARNHIKRYVNPQKY